MFTCKQNLFKYITSECNRLETNLVEIMKNISNLHIAYFKPAWFIQLIFTSNFPETDFDPNQYFNLTKNPDGYSLSVIKPIEDKMRYIKKYLLIILEAALENKIASASVIINLPEITVKFGHALYQGSYRNPVFEHDNITITSDAETDVQVALADGEYY